MPTQINIWASDELVSALKEICPEGEALSACARGVLERVLLKQRELPLLVPEGSRGPIRAEINDERILAAVGELKELLGQADEVQRETLRAVHEHGHWVRHKTNGTLDMTMAQNARDAGAKIVTDWLRSMRREEP